MESIYNEMNKINDEESLDEKYNVRTLKDVKKLHESTNETPSEQPSTTQKKKLSKNDIIYRYNFGMPMSEEDIAKIGTVEQHRENAKRIHAAVMAIKHWDSSVSVSRKRDWTSMTLFLRGISKDELTDEEKEKLTALISAASGFKSVQVYGGDVYLRCDGFVSIYPEVTELKESNSDKINKPITESYATREFEIPNFDAEIIDEFEDDGIKGYNIVYSKNGTDIVEVEVWETNSPVAVNRNLHTPHLMQSYYSSFDEFASDLEYKTSRYVL